MTYEDYVGLRFNMAMAHGAEARGVFEAIRAAFGEDPSEGFFEAVSFDESETLSRAIEWRAANQVAKGTRR